MKPRKLVFCKSEFNVPPNQWLVSHQVFATDEYLGLCFSECIRPVDLEKFNAANARRRARRYLTKIYLEEIKKHAVCLSFGIMYLGVENRSVL